MRAINEAKKLAYEMGVAFEYELAMHLQYGVVVSTDDKFGMARPISRDNPDEWASVYTDCWLVTCVVGRGCLPWFFEVLPYPLKWYAWRRHSDPSNRLRCYNASTVERLCHANVPIL